MKKFIYVASAASLVALGLWAGCSSDETGTTGGGGSSDGGSGQQGSTSSASSSKASSSSSAGAGATGGAGVGGGGGGMMGPPAACDGTVPAPSKGACVTLVPGTGGAGGGATMGAECNPVTGEPCNLGAGESCDTANDDMGLTGFTCYPAPNTIACGGDCSDPDNMNDFCKVGTTCADLTKCYAYCCDDGDCGTGTCSKGIFDPVAPDLGICVK